MRKTIKRRYNRKKNRRGGTIKNLLQSVPLRQFMKTTFQNFAGQPTKVTKKLHGIETAHTRIPRPYSRSRSIITTNSA